MTTSLRRLWTHACTGELALRRSFTAATLAAIEAAIRDCERRHAGEIRFAVEPALRLTAVWRDQGPRQRALAAFAELGVWDPAHNNGVLIYVLLADQTHRNDPAIGIDEGLAEDRLQHEYPLGMVPQRAVPWVCQD
jgi:uncharacterized membrane protein